MSLYSEMAAGPSRLPMTLGRLHDDLARSGCLMPALIKLAAPDWREIGCPAVIEGVYFATPKDICWAPDPDGYRDYWGDLADCWVGEEETA